MGKCRTDFSGVDNAISDGEAIRSEEIKWEIRIPKFEFRTSVFGFNHYSSPQTELLFDVENPACQ